MQTFSSRSAICTPVATDTTTGLKFLGGDTALLAIAAGVGNSLNTFCISSITSPTWAGFTATTMMSELRMICLLLLNTLMPRACGEDGSSGKQTREYSLELFYSSQMIHWYMKQTSCFLEPPLQVQE